MQNVGFSHDGAQMSHKDTDRVANNEDPDQNALGPHCLLDPLRPKTWENDNITMFSVSDGERGIKRESQFDRNSTSSSLSISYNVASL